MIQNGVKLEKACDPPSPEEVHPTLWALVLDLSKRDAMMCLFGNQNKIYASRDADGDEKAKGLRSVHVPDGIYYIYGENNLVMNHLKYCSLTTEGYPIKVINRTTLDSQGIVSFSSEYYEGSYMMEKVDEDGSIHLVFLPLPHDGLDIHQTGKATQFKLFVPPNGDKTNENGAYKCIIYHRGKFVRVRNDGFPISDENDPSKATVYILRPSPYQEHKSGEWANKKTVQNKRDELRKENPNPYEGLKKMFGLTKMPKNLLPTGKNFCIYFTEFGSYGKRVYLTVRSDASGFAGRLWAYFMPSRVKWLLELVCTPSNDGLFQAVYNDDDEGTFSLFIPSKNAFVGNDKTERAKFLLKSDEKTRIRDCKISDAILEVIGTGYYRREWRDHNGDHSEIIRFQFDWSH